MSTLIITSQIANGLSNPLQRPRADGAAMRSKIREAISDLTAQNGMPPTFRELCDRVGSKSTGHMSHHIGAMRAAGEIAHLPGKARCIKLVGERPACPHCAALEQEVAALREYIALLKGTGG